LPGGHQSGCVSTSDGPSLLVPQEPRHESGKEQSAHDRPARARLDSRSQPCRDRLRRRVGLLGGQPALLEREGGDVAGRVDVGQGADHLVHVVDGGVEHVLGR